MASVAHICEVKQGCVAVVPLAFEEATVEQVGCRGAGPATGLGTTDQQPSCVAAGAPRVVSGQLKRKVMTEVHPLLRLENRALTMARAGEVTTGLFLITGDTMVAEMCGLLGFDWVVLDMEASPMSKETALHCLQALSTSRTTPLVRVQANDRHLIEHALDAGAQGVLVPKIETGEEARFAAGSTRFPPAGGRGINPVRASGYFGNLPGYLARANNHVLCALQIESVRALDNIDEIAAAPDVDVLFIGAGDLASSLGQPGEVTGARMDEARETVLKTCSSAGVIPGIFAYSIELSRRYADEGFRMIALGNDIKSFREGATALLSGFKPHSS